jgi:hypothetical protein
MVYNMTYLRYLDHKSYFEFRLKKYCELFYISSEQGGWIGKRANDRYGREDDRVIKAHMTPNKVRVYSNRNNSSINQIIIRTLAEQI